jgi:ParB-like chromosome segregation protein Spo0J
MQNQNDRPPLNQSTTVLAARQTEPAFKQYEFHPLADMFPLIKGEEFDKLVDDIKAYGLREEIIVYEGKILDGRNRYNACREAKTPLKIRHFDPTTEGDPEAFVVSKNVLRRHLEIKDKKDAAAILIKADPNLSNRTIAGKVGLDHKTVSTVRKGMREDLDNAIKRWKAFGPAQQREFIEADKDNIRRLLPLIFNLQA